MINSFRNIRPNHREISASLHFDSDEDFDESLAKLRPHLAAAGGTPAFFEIYDPPPGYISPR